MPDAARLTLNLDPEQRDRLFELARRMRQSASSLVRNAIDAGLANPRFFLPKLPSDTMQRSIAPDGQGGPGEEENPE